jgi:hypothetical protein
VGAGRAERAGTDAAPGRAERAGTDAAPGRAERAGTDAAPGRAERAGTDAAPVGPRAGHAPNGRRPGSAISTWRTGHGATAGSAAAESDGDMRRPQRRARPASATGPDGIGLSATVKRFPGAGLGRTRPPDGPSASGASA